MTRKKTDLDGDDGTVNIKDFADALFGGVVRKPSYVY